MTLLVGLLDSGISDQLVEFTADSAAFQLNEEEKMIQVPPAGDRTGHGSRLARIILSASDEIALLNAQVLSDRGSGSPAIITAGLYWLIDAGARIINMSFGLTADRPILREACRHALDMGVILVASSPQRGNPVYPAAYDDVIAVTGDARCASTEYSHMPAPNAQFGACVHLPGKESGQPDKSGSSIAVAHMTRAVVNKLLSEPNISVAEIVQQLIENCRYHGAEKRTP